MLVMAVALGLLCLRGVIPDVYSVDLAYVVLFTACALMLEGARPKASARAPPPCSPVRWCGSRSARFLRCTIPPRRA